MVAFDEEESTQAVKMLHAADEGVPILNVYSSILPKRALQAANLMVGRPPDTYLENHIEFVTLARPICWICSRCAGCCSSRTRRFFDDESLRFVRDEGVIRVYENTNALPMVYLVSEVIAVKDADESIRWLEDFTGDFRQNAVIEGTRLPPVPPAKKGERRSTL